MTTLAGKRVTVMGLGRHGGGSGVARYLAEAGAVVTVTDAQPAERLAEAMAGLAGLPLRYVLGRHEEADFLPGGADFVVRNPGVPRRAPMLELARRHGVPVEMEMTLFFRDCLAPIIGVTGTKGKTTVSTLTAALLHAGNPATVLAGNMGISALRQLEQITPETPVVIELSSWQLEGLAEHGLAPAIAVLTLIAEDHLNTYDGFADYAATKRSITHHQGAADTLVVNAGDAEAWRAAAETQARVFPFGGRDDAGGDGVWWREGTAQVRWHGRDLAIPMPASPALAGAHGRANALAAIAAALARGADPAAIATGLASFTGIRDRMEVVTEVAGVAYINDTTATAPVAAAAGLAALAGRRVHLLAGGADKKLDPAPLVRAAAEHAHAVYLFDGTATPAIDHALRRCGVTPHGPYTSMTSAVAAASAAAAPGDVVLLSPGCASFGLFHDEFDRGEQFRRAVHALAAEDVRRG